MVIVWILRGLTINLVIVFLDGFITSSSLYHGEPQERIINGTLRANIEFRAPLLNSIYVIMYMEFDNSIFVDKTKQITEDY